MAIFINIPFRVLCLLQMIVCIIGIGPHMPFLIRVCNQIIGFRMAYDAFGRMNQVTYLDGSKELISYNERNYPVRIVNRDGAQHGCLPCRK